MARLPADLPEDWTNGMIVAPNGADVGYQERYGYNYLNKQVNDAQNAINDIGTTLDDVAKEVDIIDIKSRIGITTDSGATATSGTLMGKTNKLLDDVALLKKTTIGASTNGAVRLATLSKIRGASSPAGTIHNKTYTFTSAYRNQFIKSLVLSSNLSVKLNRLELEIDGTTSIDASSENAFSLSGATVFLNMDKLAAGLDDYINVSLISSANRQHEPLSFVYSTTAKITLEIEQMEQGTLDMNLGILYCRI
jgi:hypothetical protein